MNSTVQGIKHVHVRKLAHEYNNYHNYESKLDIVCN